jgi:IS5 family transposase
MRRLLASSSAASRYRTRRWCAARHLLEVHDLGRRLFDEVQRYLDAKGLKVGTGVLDEEC